MKWISNPKCKPRLGDRRYVMRFAFFPIYAWSYDGNVRYVVWLDFYKQFQIFKDTPEYYDRFQIGVIEKWVNINQYIK